MSPPPHTILGFATLPYEHSDLELWGPGTRTPVCARVSSRSQLCLEDEPHGREHGCSEDNTVMVGFACVSWASGIQDGWVGGWRE